MQIPTSVLWVILVAGWLLVVVPMVLRGRPQVRKTTQAAASTRVLHRGGAQPARRRSSAAHHPSDPGYVVTRSAARTVAGPGVRAGGGAITTEEQADMDERTDATETVEVEAELVGSPSPEHNAADTDLDVIDVVAVDEPAGTAASEAAAEGTDVGDGDAADVDAGAVVTDEDDEAESAAGPQVDGTPEAPAPDAAATDAAADAAAPARSGMSGAARPTREMRGRGGHNAGFVAERERLQYRERQRTVLTLVALTLLAVVSAFFFQPWGIVAAVVMAVATAFYLRFLRREVQRENERKAERAARARRAREYEERVQAEQESPGFVPVPDRLRRPGRGVVLEVDDEDPDFDHLPAYEFAAAFDAPQAGDDEADDDGSLRRVG